MVEISNKPKLEKVEILVERFDGTQEIHTREGTKIIKKDDIEKGNV